MSGDGQPTQIPVPESMPRVKRMFPHQAKMAMGGRRHRPVVPIRKEETAPAERKPSLAGSGRDPYRNQDTPVSKAKQYISHYKKAVGDPAGLIELVVFYCEQAAGHCQDIGLSRGRIFRCLGAHVRTSPQIGQDATRKRPG